MKKRPRKRASTPARRPGAGRAPRGARSRSRRMPVPPSIVVPDGLRPLTIVGVGASAGGLEAFSALLQGLPANPGIAVVFVQHLAPHHDSALVSLLSRHSALPVVQAVEGMRVERNRVYVIPPNAQMVITGQDLHIGPRPDDRSQYTPVDAFFSSLARAAGKRAIGVVLSGTASDGVLGIREIKAAGGLAIAQDPESAKYDGMPRAAIATGMVDLVLAVEAIGPELVELSASAHRRETGTRTSGLAIRDDQLHEVFDLLQPVSGVDFRHYKLPTIKRRLLRRMALHRLDDIDQYVQLLRRDVAEVHSLYSDLLIHVTRFFREPESYAALARYVFPSMIDGQPADRQLRVWVSGCATGEEAYSLAIVLLEYLQQHRPEMRVQIFATDVSETAIEQARNGVYPLSIEAHVSRERLRRFFSKLDGRYRINKMVRDLCVFARQDLTKDPPFSRLDLILCRNVLIYMDLVLQKKLLSVFHYALNPRGFLVLGQAETVGAQAALFSLVDKKFRVHRKKDMATLPTMTFPVDYAAAGGHPARPVPTEMPKAGKFLQSEVNRLLMDRFAPPGVVIDNDMQIVEFRGQTRAFLEPAPGEASLNLLKMAKEGLLYGLRTTINSARKSRGAVRKDGFQVRVGKGWRPVSLEVIPLAATGRLHHLVLFHDAAGDKAARPRDESEPPSKRLTAAERKSRIGFLQKELAASREYLQSIIQELEAANEELQAANEEVLSSNEELQSTNEELDTAKEELQSTNEELNTVNEELHGRNEELSRVNSDLLNLLASVHIAIVIVASDLRIRRFTPMAEKVLNLIPGDVDRQIGHIKPNIDADLPKLITECIDTVSPLEREVQDHQGRWYSLRIRPYRSVDNHIEGAVLALFDVDAPKRHEESSRLATAFADSVVHGVAEPMAVLDTDLRLRALSPKFAELFGITGDIGRLRSLGEFVRPSRGLDQLSKLIARDRGVSSAIVVDLEPRGAKPLAIEARAFSGLDGPKSRLVLLTAAPDRAGTSD